MPWKYSWWSRMLTVTVFSNIDDRPKNTAAKKWLMCIMKSLKLKILVQIHSIMVKNNPKEILLVTFVWWRSIFFKNFGIKIPKFDFWQKIALRKIKGGLYTSLKNILRKYTSWSTILTVIFFPKCKWGEGSKIFIIEQNQKFEMKSGGYVDIHQLICWIF